MGSSCGTCGGSGWVTESMEYDEYDKDGNKTTKTGTKQVTCSTCGGKGYTG